MTDRVSSFTDLSAVTARLDEVLCAASFDNDARRKAQIAIAFSELLAGTLDAKQSEAIAVAKLLWATGDDSRHAEMVDEFAKRIDADQRTKSAVQEAAINRLVFSALSKNTGLSSYAGDFLIGLGTDAGLTANQMATIFASLVPGFE